MDVHRFDNDFSTRQNTRSDSAGQVVSVQVNGHQQTIRCGGPVKDATGLMALVLGASYATGFSNSISFFGFTGDSGTPIVIFTSARTSRSLDKAMEVEFTFMRWSGVVSS